MTTFDAVIFDMDGLLVDSEPVWMICEREMLATRGKTWDFDVQQKLIGTRMDDFLRGMIVGYGLTDPFEDMRDEILGRMCELVPKQVLYRPGAPELLEWLNAEGIPCAIASSSPMPVIEVTVESQRWAQYFPVRVSGDEVENGKPNPDVYLEAARRVGARPTHCLALEDSPNGARAAVAAGMTTYVVPDPSHAQPQLFADITPYVFDSLHNVLKQLRQK
jgi:HAD superfamily hydrolase (TIGR01509 family)